MKNGLELYNQIKYCDQGATQLDLDLVLVCTTKVYLYTRTLCRFWSPRNAIECGKFGNSRRYVETNLHLRCACHPRSTRLEEIASMCALPLTRVLACRCPLPKFKKFARIRKVNETYLEVEVCLTFYRPRAPTKVK